MSRVNVSSSRQSVRNAQRGAIMLVCLMLLLGLTVVGIASMRETVVQQKVINMALEDDTSFQAAESALRAGEALVISRARTPQKIVIGATSGTSLMGLDGKSAAYEWWKDRDSATWDSGITVSFQSRDAAVQRSPSYVIEVFDEALEQNSTEANSSVFYRITARGFGVNDAFYTVLQSTVSVSL